MATPTEADLTLSANAETVLARRYLARDAAGNLIERPADLLWRVARTVAAAEREHGQDPATWERAFFDLMARRDFLPNSPALMNAGHPLGQLAACFVVPVDDSMPAIFDAVKWAAMIQMSGGGTGFAFSRLRPAGDRVASTGGAASGPVPFMDIFNSATDTIVQGGRRRGANMGILRVDHPDVVEFVRAKLDPRRLTNFNLSVAVTDAFMHAVAVDGEYALINPRSGQEVRKLRARVVWRLIANLAWQSGEPGVVFIDRINAQHPAAHVGPIESTNPCVTGDTRVLTQAGGWVRIDELVGQTPEVATQLGGEVVFRTATQVWKTGVRAVYRLRTVEGHELRLTEDHRVTAAHGDVPAIELEPGDQLQLLTLPRLDPPARTTPEGRLGEVIGYLSSRDVLQMGGGRARITFVGEGDAMVDRVRAELGDLELRHDDDADGDELLERFVESHKLVDALLRRGIDESCHGSVPEVVWNGSRELQIGYVRGLFEHQGTLSHENEVTFGLDQPELARELVRLLLGLGVAAYVIERPDSLDHAATVTVHRAAVAAYVHTIGCIDGERLLAIQRMVAKDKRLARAPRFATVLDLTYQGEEPVYDLTEPSSSHFFANGLLVHNCGEQPLLPFESCVLGSLNVANFVKDGALDEVRLGEATRLATRFLDDVIDASRYPLPQIGAITRANRKIGLGVMGFADLLIELGIAYDSDAAVAFADRLMALVERESVAASRELARERGPFANYRGSSWDKPGALPMRNATTTTVAPTGTISIIAGCSSGIEPLFAVSFVRNVLEGTKLTEVHPGFRELAERRGFASAELFDTLAERGRVRGLASVPADVQALFATAHDVTPEQHVRIQAAFQRHVHSSVSKTINLPREATPEDVARVYDLAYQSGCKGVTIYRDGSREAQVLSFGTDAATATDATTTVPLPVEAGCPECGKPVFHGRGCLVCESCGWSRCG